jgi:hemerythrin
LFLFRCRLRASLAAGHEKQAIPFVERLIAFAEDHFRREEKLLAAWGYPEVTIHCQYHRGLGKLGAKP